MKKLLTPCLALLLLMLATSPGFAAWDDGVSAFRAGRFAEAADAFRAVVDGRPDAPQGYYMLGLSLASMSRASEALAALAKAVEIQPGNGEYRMALAQTQLKARRAGDALTTLSAFDAATVAEAQRATFGTLLANAAAESGRDAEAARLVAAGLAAVPDSKPLWLARAQLEQRLGHPRESFDATVSAYELDRRDADLGQRAVQAAFAQARAEDGEARRDWYGRGSKVAVALAEAEPTAQHLRLAGEARMGARDYRGALPWFERAAAAAAEDPLPRFYLARCALALDDAAAALRHLDAALERSPGAELSTDVWNARGSALRHLERFGEAAAAYRRAGNEAKVAEMDKLLEIQKNNETWLVEKRRCAAKQRTVRARLAENDYLEGTAAWRELEKKASEDLADCEPYLKDAG